MTKLGRMSPAVALAFSFLVTVLSSSLGLDPTGGVHRPVHPLRQRSGSAGHPIGGVSCQSWRLAVETNNARGWKTVPASCEKYVGNYMLGDRYRKDSAMVVSEAIEYAESFKLNGDGKDVWVFDIDETTLSNLPYYAHHGFGVELYNATAFDEWVLTGKAPPLPESLKLYRNLLSLDIKIVFLSGRGENKRSTTTSNLKKAGYHTWEKLLLKKPGVKGSAVAYKSEERQKLVKGGFRIIGNIGDQWSDILGSPEGARTFKVPDPMYYIS